MALADAARQLINTKLQENAYRMEDYHKQSERLVQRVRNRCNEPDSNVLRYFILNDLPNIIAELADLDKSMKITSHEWELLSTLLAADAADA